MRSGKSQNPLPCRLAATPQLGATMPPCCYSSARSWTLTCLIGSYVDLALAYLFLIGSTIIFLASKFLSVFGLALPCPCADGLFGHPDGCIQTVLLDSARTRIESLNGSIRTRFPFNVIFEGTIGSESDRTLLTAPEGDGDEEGEDRVVIGNRVAPVIGRRIRRRRVSGWRKGDSVSVSVSPARRLSWQEEEGLGDNFDWQSKEAESSVGLGSGDVQRIVEDSASIVGDASPATLYYSMEDTSPAVRDVRTCNGNLEFIIKNLERELEEAQAAHSVLYLELEKERSAAASAADEAMAMILRLQSEKAAVEMESRQYQRMIEEKSAYDEEEMEILKEIIVRREREKRVLEKEVEAYRQMMISGEITGEKPDSLFDSSDDPTLMLKTIYDSIGKKEKLNSNMEWTDNGAGIHFPGLPGPGEEYNIEVQEKGMLMVDIYPSGHCQSSSCREDAIRYTSEGPQELGFCKGPSCLSGEGDAGKASKIEMSIPVDALDGDDHDGDLRGSDSSQFETKSSVLDVHVVEEKHNLGEENGTASNSFNEVCASEVSAEGGGADDLPETSSVDLLTKTLVMDWVRVEQDIQRSSSDVTTGCQVMDTLNYNAPHFDLRRRSMSAVDSEKFKLETEVELLRKRLKTIQQGRENLSFSTEFRENKPFQLQLLEEIAHQLQQIRKITEPGKRIRQASLPPLSPKVRSKKRRCRSVSSGLHDSA